MSYLSDIIYLGLKELDRITRVNGDTCNDECENSKEVNDNERQTLLLKGLKKLRNIGNRTNVDNRIKGFRMLRTLKDKDVLRSFVHYAMRHMIPIHVWTGAKQNMKISHIFSIHDEAFAILILMNNWKVWEAMANGEKRTRGARTTDTLFTNKKCYINNVEMYTKGWSNDGLKEFNIILRYLISVRNKKEQKDMEQKLLEEEQSIAVTSGKKRKRVNNDEIINAEREIPLDAYTLQFSQE